MKALLELTLSLVTLASVASNAWATDWFRLLPTRPSFPNDDATCIRNPADRFEPGARGLSGVDGGKCIPQDLYRPSIILRRDESASLGLPVEPKRLNLANVADLEGFVAASIPLEDIVESRLLVEHYILPLPVKIDPGHVMFRVRFGSDVVLRPQVGEGPTRTTRDLVFSFQSSHRFVVDGNMANRLLDGSYSLVPVTFTTVGKIKGPPSYGKNSFEQWRLNLDAEAMSNYIARFVELSNRFMLSRPYLLTEANCATEIFPILDRMFSYTQEQQSAISRTSEGEFVPTKSAESIAARGLMDLVADKLPNVEDESGSDL
jgi:hypothetical protein